MSTVPLTEGTFEESPSPSQGSRSSTGGRPGPGRAGCSRRSSPPPAASTRTSRSARSTPLRRHSRDGLASAFLYLTAGLPPIPITGAPVCAVRRTRYHAADVTHAVAPEPHGFRNHPG